MSVKLVPYSDTGFVLISSRISVSDLESAVNTSLRQLRGFALSTGSALRDAVFDGLADPRLKWRLCFKPEFPNLRKYLIEHECIPEYIAQHVDDDDMTCVIGDLSSGTGDGIGALCRDFDEEYAGLRMIADLFGWTIEEDEE